MRARPTPPASKPVTSHSAPVVARPAGPRATRGAANSAHPPPPRGAAAAIAARPGLVDDTPPIVSHPDGWYWIAPDGHQQFGPFETYEMARVDRDAWDEESPSPGPTLQEAEDEIGIASWIDPETGEPAEGASPPHLDAEGR